MSEQTPEQTQTPATPPAGRPAASPGAGGGRPKMMVDLDPSGQVTGREPDRSNRQFMNYAFFKLDPAFRRLPQAERDEIKAEFLTAAEGWVSDAPAQKGLILRPYSLVGVRGDVDFMLWRIAFDVREFTEAQARLNRTRLMGYLTQPYNFVSMNKRSQYVNRVDGSGHGLEVLPGQGQFLFIYPFVKTRAWYDLTPHSRQGMMDEHIHASVPFKGVRINTSYSYGIDDQEFVVAFETGKPSDFVDLVMALRETESSLFTLRDTPIFTCVRAETKEILDQLA